MQTVLITGASHGIGRAIAQRFAKEGTKNIIITGFKSKEELLKLKEELVNEYGVNCISYICDIGEYKAVEKMINEINSQTGGVDVLVNNAGICHIGLLSDMSEYEWQRVINTNLTSVFNCSKLSIPHMVRQHKGKIINISSVWGICGASMETAYSASKGGVNAFTKALAKELAPSNIQVNAVACGAINTKMNAHLDDEELRGLIEEIPSDRLGEPEEVAELVYMLSTGNEYLTGQVIQLDGAWI